MFAVPEVHSKYRVLIHYRRISLDHNLNRKCRKIVKFVSITHSERNIWSGPIVAPAILRKKRKPFLEGNGYLTYLAYLVCPGHPVHQTWQCVVSSCGVSSRTMFTSHHFQRLPELHRALQQRNWERHTRHDWEGLAGIGVSPGHLPCHTWGAHRKHLRSLWNCKHSSFKW